MRIIIAGSRTCTEEQVREALAKCPWIGFVSAVVSGTAKGADEFGERWAEQHNIEIIRFPANWKEFGRKAGPMRNKVMAENADGLVAVWDGSSKGTQSMIELARRFGLRVFVLETTSGKILEYPAAKDHAQTWENAEERASILEFSNGMTRQEAERQAGREQRCGHVEQSAKMGLVFTVTSRGDVPKRFEDQLVAAVPPSFSVHTEQLVAFSAGGIPPWIQMLGDAIEWKAYLGDAAKLLLGALGTKLWSIARDNAPPILRNAKVKVLLDLSLAIHSIIHAGDDNKATVAVGLRFPNDHYGTNLSAYGDSVEDIAFKLAIFAHEAEAIEKLLRDEIQNRMLDARIRMTLDPAGVIHLKWILRGSEEWIERRIEVQAIVSPQDDNVEAESTGKSDGAPISVDFGKQ